MSITATCGACGRKFVAPSQFQGKRVKCKGCGEIFMVPSASSASNFAEPVESESDPLDQMASIGTNDATAFGMDQTSLERSPHDDVDDTDEHHEETAAVPTLSPVSRSGVRPNVLTFDYPGASDIDQWLPIVTIIFGFLVLAASVSSPSAKGIGWISFVRFITPTLLYLGLTFPITLGMIRRAGRLGRFGMPPNFQLRCFACYMPAFVFITWMQMSGEGFSIAQIIVGILGLGLSSALLWLLFRLREEHIGTTAAYGAGGFAAGAVLALALTFGLNKMGALIVSSQHAEASVPTSPFGEGLAWVSLPTVRAAVPARPAPDAIITTATTMDVAPTPADAASLGTFDPGSIPGSLDDIIDPLGNSSIIGVVRNKANGISIESWNTQIWQRQPGALQLPARPEGHIVMSTDGDRVAWIAEFPRLSVQVWSYNHERVVATVDLDRSSGHAELVGFISPDLLLIDRVTSPSIAAAPETPASTATPPAVIPDDAVPAPVNSTPGANRLSDALSGASDHVRAKMPTAPVPSMEGAPVLPPPPKSSPDSPAPDQQPSSHQMWIVDVTTGATVRSFSLPALAVDLAAGWGKSMSDTLRFGRNIELSVMSRRLAVATRVDDTPAIMQIDLLTGKSLPTVKITELDPGLSGCPTGLAYSNDGLSLVTLFENGGSALLLAYDSTTGKRVSNFVYPSGPLEGAEHGEFKGSAVIWLDPSPFWLVYGQGVISTQTGAHLKSADLNMCEPLEERALDDDRIEIVCNKAGAKKLTVLKLDRSKLEASQGSAEN